MRLALKIAGSVIVALLIGFLGYKLGRAGTAAPAGSGAEVERRYSGAAITIYIRLYDLMETNNISEARALLANLLVGTVQRFNELGGFPGYGPRLQEARRIIGVETKKAEELMQSARQGRTNVSADTKAAPVRSDRER